ncbi:MAG: protein kinase domain-containing protein [Planctomycetota bacterium]|jgi:tRNA A-37 threonylcarbamoyl transferase component Bud32
MTSRSSLSRSHIGRLSGRLGLTTLVKGRRRSWLLPIVIAVVLLGVGLWTRASIEDAVRRDLRDGLESFLSVGVAAVEEWLAQRARTAEVIAEDPEVLRIAAELNKLDGDNLATSPLQEEFMEAVRVVVETNGYLGSSIIDPSGRILTARRRELINTRLPLLQPLLATEKRTVVSPPRQLGEDLAIIVLTRLGDGGSWLGFAIDPQRFTRQLAKGRLGESAETYAFDAEGTLISYSRFESALHELGILKAGQRSILNVAVRDPGGNMVDGFRPTSPVKARSLTTMAASAIEMRESGTKGLQSNIEGYPDYRGVPVVGAWTWLHEYDMGVTTEQDVAEAYSYVMILRRNLWILFSLLGLAAVGAAIYNFSLQKLRAKVSEAQQLGQYTIAAKIGAGGMGEVYRATHAMLKRPTAIKLLPAEFADEERKVRFEREVQNTAQLSHHNTVAIYDYGTSPDGSFYYAMEYVAGVTLYRMVAEGGPLPPARVANLLRQACGSFAEAHGLGIVHRDIKPANLMVAHSTGMPDHLKVLDFGLVKIVGATDESVDVTQPGNVLGTPRYLSPEAIRDADAVDARSDLYALGAVGYFLATGTHLFEGETVVQIINHHLNTEPERPSERLGQPVPKALEDVLLWCLEKDPDDRPISAEALYDRLHALSSDDIGTWTREDANNWWRNFRMRVPGVEFEGNDAPTKAL